MSNEIIWCHAEREDEERLQGQCGSREEAIAEGRAEYEGDFFVFACERPDPADFIDSADEIIESMAENAYHEVPDHVEDYPDVTDEAREELGQLLQAWARKHCQPNFWVATGNGERIEPET